MTNEVTVIQGIETRELFTAKINNEALESLVSLGLNKELSKLLVTAIAKGEVPHISIKY